MKEFGSCINYILVDLINIYKNNTPDNFEIEKINYLKKENINFLNYYKLDYNKMTKIIDFIDKYVDIITPENEMKISFTINKNEPIFVDDKINDKCFDFKYIDKIYKFARDNNLKMRFHTIIWYKYIPEQLLNYLKDKSKTEKRNLTLLFLKEYMKRIKQRYSNIYAIDVINEIAADPDEINFYKMENKPIYKFDENGIRKDDWYNLIGKDYYIEIFKIARKIFGNIKLFYNDCNEGNKLKQKYFTNIITNIKQYEKENNIHLIDGFGMQSHYWGSNDENKKYMEDMYSFYTKLNLEIQITEFDISNHSTKKMQESIFENFIEIIQNYNINTFTTWGLNDLVSWYSEYDATLIDKNCDFKDFTQKYLNYFSNKSKNFLN